MHLLCIKKQIENKWNRLRIAFNYLNCPECRQLIQSSYSPEIDAILKNELEFKDKLEELALETAKIENLHNDPRL